VNARHGVLPACPIQVKMPKPICRDWKYHTGLEAAVKRRLYFLLPDTGHSHAVVNDMKVFGPPSGRDEKPSSAVLRLL
jgi:hypothetical protein